MTCRWYKQSIIYSLDVETFKDGNGDGIGDFIGLTECCRYLSGLGADCVWLLPFFKSPNRDNGYDVVDYYSVDPRLGTMGDFVAFMDEARNRQLRVLIDLVINHTSAEHPWFKDACQSRDNLYHDFYVWRYDEPPETKDKTIFPPKQEGIWTHVKEVDGWYLHRFYRFQPDLNIKNPRVRQEMMKIMAFWLKLGVSGFRVDAVPFLIEVGGLHEKSAKEEVEYAYLDEFRDFVSWQKGDAVLLAEANVSQETQLAYFGKGDRMHMVFNFLLNQEIFLGMALRSSKKLAEYLAQMPDLPAHSQWGVFLRNHDELSLSRLPEEEREACFREFGPEKEMQIYGRGIRRRMAPMFGGDEKKILFAYSLLFSLPGTPVLWYGEEIGMGDDLSQPERWSVRTPMQWSAEENGGFSTAPGEKMVRPVISEGEYGYDKVNVRAQERSGDSIYGRVQQMIRVRKHNPEFSCGRFKMVNCDRPGKVLVYQSEHDGQMVAAVHNFTEEKQTVTADFQNFEGDASDLLGNSKCEVEGGKCRFELEPLGYRWIRLRKRQKKEPS